MAGDQEGSGWIGPAILAGVAGIGVWRSLSPGSRENIWRFVEALAEEHERKKLAELVQDEQLIIPSLEGLDFGSYSLEIPSMAIEPVVEAPTEQVTVQDIPELQQQPTELVIEQEDVPLTADQVKELLASDDRSDRRDGVRAIYAMTDEQEKLAAIVYALEGGSSIRATHAIFGALRDIDNPEVSELLVAMAKGEQYEDFQRRAIEVLGHRQR